MTCFWDSILTALNNDDFRIIDPNIKKMNNKDFVIFLKNNNTKTINITWNGEKLTDKQLEENYQHIKDFNPSSIYNGYFCSTCEPFIFLVSYLFKVNINHNYRDNIMKYRIENARKTFIFGNNTGHFYYINTIK